MYDFSKDLANIRDACKAREDFEMRVPVEYSCWASHPDEVPQEWTYYSPANLTENACNDIQCHVSDNQRGKFIILELEIHRKGGILEYKSGESGIVFLRVCWSPV